MIISQPAMEAMFQLRIVTVTVVKEICRISLVNKYSKALDSGEAREVHLSSHVATCHLFNSLTYWKAVWKEKRTLSISQIETVDKKANHEFSGKIVFFFWGGGGGCGGECCFAHKSIYWLDFEILIVSALYNLTIAVKFLTERKRR